jgi:hypothetical protein
VNEVLHFVADWQRLPAAQGKRFVQEKRLKIRRLSRHALQSPWAHYSKALKSAKFRGELENASDRSELAFRRIEALRVSLAKHEVPKSKGALAVAPGYGRIDMSSGSISWQLVLEGKEVDLVSRRTIANQCREISQDFSKFILPRPLQPLLAGFSRHSYGTKRVAVSLRDKRTFDGVIVAWDKQIVFVEGQSGMPFHAKDIVDVKASPRKVRIPRKKKG